MTWLQRVRGGGARGGTRELSKAQIRILGISNFFRCIRNILHNF